MMYKKVKHCQACLAIRKLQTLPLQKHTCRKIIREINELITFSMTTANIYKLNHFLYN